MAARERAHVVATGVLLEEPSDAVAAYVEARGFLTPEARHAIASARAGEVVLLRAASFADVDDGRGVQRHRLPARGPHAVPVGAPATRTLLAMAADEREDQLAALALGGVRVARFDLFAAPRRIELDDDVRRRLRLD